MRLLLVLAVAIPLTFAAQQRSTNNGPLRFAAAAQQDIASPLDTRPRKTRLYPPRLDEKGPARLWGLIRLAIGEAYSPIACTS